MTSDRTTRRRSRHARRAAGTSLRHRRLARGGGRALGAAGGPRGGPRRPAVQRDRRGHRRPARPDRLPAGDAGRGRGAGEAPVPGRPAAVRVPPDRRRVAALLPVLEALLAWGRAYAVVAHRPRPETAPVGAPDARRRHDVDRDPHPREDGDLGGPDGDRPGGPRRGGPGVPAVHDRAATYPVRRSRTCSAWPWCRCPTGEAVFTLTPDESMFNPIGAVHGGVVCTLLDSALGCALHTTLPAGKGYTSVEIKVSLPQGRPPVVRPAHRDRTRRTRRRPRRLHRGRGT